VRVRVSPWMPGILHCRATQVSIKRVAPHWFSCGT
jgi:hypothetical protein